jgi:hypothetical protein
VYSPLTGTVSRHLVQGCRIELAIVDRQSWPPQTDLPSNHTAAQRSLRWTTPRSAERPPTQDLPLSRTAANFKLLSPPSRPSTIRPSISQEEPHLLPSLCSCFCSSTRGRSAPRIHSLARARKGLPGCHLPRSQAAGPIIHPSRPVCPSQARVTLFCPLSSTDPS